MANSIIMPKTGMAMEEGTILEWRIKAGDSVKKGDIVALIETDKATMELESDYDGIILAILNQAGETVPVTRVIAWVGEKGEAVPAGAAEAEKTEVKTSGSSPAQPAPEKTDIPPAPGIRATPAARALAKEHGIDLKAIAGSGRYGEIRQKAVDEALKSYAMVSAVSQTDMPISRTAAAKGDSRVPLTNIQKITGRRMSESRQTIPEVTAHIKANVTHMLELREELNNSIAVVNLPGKITINDFVLAAVVRALQAYPRINSVLDGNDLIYKGSINLGMAVATKRGLVVPVIHNAGDYSLAELSSRAAELASGAREGTLKTEDMTGGTFTVSNIGMYGITSFTPIINPPEAAILGVCAISDELRFDPECNSEEKVICQKMMGLSLAYDHRIVDGAESSLFLKEIRDILESPLLILI